jgi:Family of unknown function (DUF6334)
MDLSDVNLSDIFFKEDLCNLSKVIHVFDEEIGDKPIVVLMYFQEKIILISVIDEDDSIDISSYDSYELKDLKTIDVSNDIPWKDVINIKLFWVWSLTNQRGYTDGIQFEWINRNLNLSIKIQLTTMLSCLKIHKVE